jgi:hypothetical protein
MNHKVVRKEALLARCRKRVVVRIWLQSEGEHRYWGQAISESISEVREAPANAFFQRSTTSQRTVSCLVC